MFLPFLPNSIYLCTKETSQVRSATKATSPFRLPASLEISAAELAKESPLLLPAEFGYGVQRPPLWF